MNFLKKIDKIISKPLIIAFFILLLGGIITFYQNKFNNIEIPDKTRIIVTANNIMRGQEITGSDLKEKEVYAKDMHTESIIETKDLVGKIAKTNLIKDREILESEVVEKKNWAKDEERDLGLRFEHFTELVGGSAIPGEVVDIMLSYEEYEDKEIETVISGVELREIYDDSNIAYTKTKDKFNFKPVTVLIRITEDQEKALDLAKKKGNLYLRRHSNYLNTIDISTDEMVDEIVITGGE